MNSFKKKSIEQSITPNKIIACIKQAALGYSRAHCSNGESVQFFDHFPRNLCATIKLTAQSLDIRQRVRLQIDDRKRLVCNESELEVVAIAMKQCSELPYRDLAYSPVIEVLLQTLLQSRFSELVSIMAGRIALAETINELIDQVNNDVYPDAMEHSLIWQKESEQYYAGIKADIEPFFEADVPLQASKVDLLRKKFLPKDKAQARSFYELTSETLHNKPNSLHRADIAAMQLDLKAFQMNLERTMFTAPLRGAVLISNFSRIHGFYLTAVLLFDGSSTVEPETLIAEVNQLWDDVTGDDAHVHHWNFPECQWAGVISPGDTAKRAALLHELECRVLQDRYVRAKGAEAISPFKAIQFTRINTQELHHE